ncbi:hypothetical protein [Celeribacter halophilus]|uniref:hypothetical protein n=1 Tax=Celeribacter halophilus TaxID=576117 RepID=UPI003A918CBE
MKYPPQVKAILNDVKIAQKGLFWRTLAAFFMAFRPLRQSFDNNSKARQHILAAEYAQTNRLGSLDRSPSYLCLMGNGKLKGSNYRKVKSWKTKQE